jgi:hypothetical protein
MNKDYQPQEDKTKAEMDMNIIRGGFTNKTEECEHEWKMDNNFNHNCKKCRMNGAELNHYPNKKLDSNKYVN